MIEPLKTDFKNLQFTMMVQCVSQTFMIVIPSSLFWLSVFLQYEGSVIFAVILEIAPGVTSISTMLSIPEFRTLVKDKLDSFLDLTNL